MIPYRTLQFGSYSPALEEKNQSRFSSSDVALYWMTHMRDSRNIAKLLEINMLKKIYVLSEEDRANRELLRTRRQLMEHRSDVMRQIKSRLLLYGIKSRFPQKRS